MKRRKVVDGSQLPAKLPLTWTIATWLLLDHFHVPGWMWGVYWTLVAIVWFIAALAVWTGDGQKLKELTPESENDGR